VRRKVSEAKLLIWKFARYHAKMTLRLGIIGRYVLVPGLVANAAIVDL